jgi:hypothetical protein
MMAKKTITPSLKNPFDPPEKVEFTIPGEVAGVRGGYEEVMQEGHDLIQRPIKSVAVGQIEKQHFKKRMTVWERINVLTQAKPNILFQNWGKNLDGASLVTGILNINGRDVLLFLPVSVAWMATLKPLPPCVRSVVWCRPSCACSVSMPVVVLICLARVASSFSPKTPSLA